MRHRTRNISPMKREPCHETMRETIIKKFQDLFHEEPENGCFFAPGRINLIGEHIDYNGGHVLPCSLTMGTYAAVRKRSDRRLRMYSVNFPEEGVAEQELDAVHAPDSDAACAASGAPDPHAPDSDAVCAAPDIQTAHDGYRQGGHHSWTSYLTGVMQVFAEKGMRMDTGLDIVIGGDLPSGAGLSSSASLEVLTGRILRDLYGFPVSEEEIARNGQRAEQQHVGVNCGIMDQFACAVGRKGYAIELDTVSLAYRHIPLPAENVSFVLTNTNVKHDLRTSAYNQRRQECAEALRLLNERAGGAGAIPSLCALTPAEFETLCDGINDPVLRRRAAHAVYENDRVKRAVDALTKSDLTTFGQLLNESHRSLRDDYEVSCYELDVLAETAQGIPGALGSRMMGGGFGGCTISLVTRDALGPFRQAIEKVYLQKTGKECSVITVS